MNYKMTTIITGTMLAITGATLPALATVSSTNDQHWMDRQHEVHLSEKMHTTIFANHKDEVMETSQDAEPDRICYDPNHCFQNPPPSPIS